MLKAIPLNAQCKFVAPRNSENHHDDLSLGINITLCVQCSWASTTQRSILRCLASDRSRITRRWHDVRLSVLRTLVSIHIAVHNGLCGLPPLLPLVSSYFLHMTDDGRRVSQTRRTYGHSSHCDHLIESNQLSARFKPSFN